MRAGSCGAGTNTNRVRDPRKCDEGDADCTRSMSFVISSTPERRAAKGFDDVDTNEGERNGPKNIKERRDEVDPDDASDDENPWNRRRSERITKGWSRNTSERMTNNDAPEFEAESLGRSARGISDKSGEISEVYVVSDSDRVSGRGCAMAET